MRYQDHAIEAITSDEIVNIVFIVDQSPSVENFMPAMNQHFANFIEHFKQSHHSEKIYTKIITFYANVVEETGFVHIENLHTFSFGVGGHGTAVNDACILGLQELEAWNSQLLSQGISSKNLIFCITDGMDNESSSDARDVKMRIEKMSRGEIMMDFQTIFIGVSHGENWERISHSMGFHHTASVGKSPKEIRKMINIISQSVSASLAAEDLDEFTLPDKIDF